MKTQSDLEERQAALIQMNAGLLRQALGLLAEIDDQTYCAVPKGMAPLRAGSHLRHILEFYECFLDGLDWAHVDYDARRRDESLERSRAAAARRIEWILSCLENAPELKGDGMVFVRAEDAGGLGLKDAFLLSSVGRELLALSSHTVHHFALIAVALRALGVEPGRDFGVAPSTLRFLSARKMEAA